MCVLICELVLCVFICYGVCGQMTTLGVSLYLPPCLRQGLFGVTALVVYQASCPKSFWGFFSFCLLS